MFDPNRPPIQSIELTESAEGPDAAHSPATDVEASADSPEMRAESSRVTDGAPAQGGAPLPPASVARVREVAGRAGMVGIADPSITG